MGWLNRVGDRLSTMLLVLVSIALVSCSDPETTPASTPPPNGDDSATTTKPSTTPPSSSTTPEDDPPEVPDDPNALVDRGRAVYNANCIACHNVEPGVDGALGPAVAGASFDLIEARVMRNEYPEGYTPKRDTKVMIALPYLEPDLAALAAYLAE